MADFYSALQTTWNASGLNDTFKALWDSDTDEYFVINQQEAPGEQPFPYVVMNQTSSNTLNRMSGCGNTLREVRDIQIVFNVHTREREDDLRTAEAIAAYLVEEIMKVFGGHPTENPTGTVTLSNGNHLITTYQNDYHIVTEEGICQWVVIYNFRIDVPVAV
jgi:hypothetical protein